MDSRALRDNLRLMSGIWAHRQSGTLEVQPSRKSQRIRSLAISQGSLSRGDGFQALNAALSSGRIRFIVHHQDQTGDWEQLGRFLFARAQKLVLQTPLPNAIPKTYGHRCSITALRVLTSMSLEQLSFSHNDDGDDLLTRRALALMGLISAEPVRPRLPKATAEVSLDWSLHDLHHIIATTAPSTPAEAPITDRIRVLIDNGAHGRARAAAESALLTQMQQPRLRCWLAIAWLSDSDFPLAERVDQARLWLQPSPELQATLERADIWRLDEALKQLRQQPAIHRLLSAQRRWIREIRSLLAQPVEPIAAHSKNFTYHSQQSM